MPIIRRNYCIYATLVFVTLYGCRIDTVISPDDGHMVTRNMYRREINILSRILHLVEFICKVYPNLPDKKLLDQVSLIFRSL